MDKQYIPPGTPCLVTLLPFSVRFCVHYDEISKEAPWGMVYFKFNPRDKTDKFPHHRVITEIDGVPVTGISEFFVDPLTQYGAEYFSGVKGISEDVFGEEEG